MEPKICNVCLDEHDDAIHAATLSVHQWFHDQVTLGLYDDYDELELMVEPTPELLAS
jgi:hypothetical protein